MTPLRITRRLADAHIFHWAGKLYALSVTRHLGLEGRAGLLRVGLVHYRTAEEVDQLPGS